LNNPAIQSHVRERSRSARERSRSLRATSQQLREALETLRAVAPTVSSPKPAAQFSDEQPQPFFRHPLDMAAWTRERVRKACTEARTLCRRAAGLRNQAASFRARSETLGRNLMEL
jgi:hypothetical protein